MIIIFINCSLFPFVEMILSGQKKYETRNKNTLKSLIGKTVYLAETGKGKKPVIYGSCTITDSITISDKRIYNQYRKNTCIVKGSVFDWKCSTTKKVLYRLDSVKRCNPFPLPDNVVRHGRIYCETV